MTSSIMLLSEEGFKPYMGEIGLNRCLAKIYIFDSAVHCVDDKFQALNHLQLLS